MSQKIQTALISVYHKDGLEEILQELNNLRVKFISTGGTREFIESLGYECEGVEEVSGYPSILGGRVKTLHPKIFGGILYRRENEADKKQVKAYDIPSIDLVIVDLYPFEQTVAAGGSEEEIIEKIDIGGISLIRGAAKNHKNVLIVSSREQYKPLYDLLKEKQGETDEEDRRWFAKEAFKVSSGYDSAIFRYFDENANSALRVSHDEGKQLRYGENPHQKGIFYGDFNKIFDQIHGKEISYNNLLDIDAAISLIADFDETALAILKHNNACGMACRPTVKEAWEAALAADPVSAFGGIVVTNRTVDKAAAEAINSIFFEVIIAPSYDKEALEILFQKKNRIILVLKSAEKALQPMLYRSVLNGMLVQDRNASIQSAADLKVVTDKAPTASETEDLLFANILVKHTKSNAIVLAKNKQLIASGTGQTSRVDALNQAIEKAGTFKFDLHGAVMASDAFFPFADSVEIAHQAGITAVIQPGGSIRDADTVDYCNKNGVAMVTTGVRHFKH
ncbi:MAG TPA: bifunctional phosphoribosylaminoimidazolecarboxamide formyltransferase/IMP cyclohydrolase [Proteiniphilum sp.]|nr:bifunctional phosphoribosylaminoimidazolecarboxamide formyltransferase/IMP cyclohydrolase [Proteiniphilum sp.]HPD86069.1 bifunctional phosphoribosylaminoimidazolecarboxamide formyltransferase/IMP cyclohydrolase [Proteiniphilum sp.]HPJ49404.1 bifunctional phosphoribosylaminoimidazolecarboxamide formyltransferase/IMP cyclohydrolase [Proteiniphilum sp.]HPR20919.1 bifunctional phosphoribosylaminoimidazolecarboxamide formyltransferase/IMP cyclohydrolase [Proteiniphilum sp.]